MLLALICSDWSIAHTDVPTSAMSDKYVPVPDRHGDHHSRKLKTLAHDTYAGEVRATGQPAHRHRQSNSSLPAGAGHRGAIGTAASRG